MVSKVTARIPSNERRRIEGLKLGLALQIGFARMRGRPLNSVRAPIRFSSPEAVRTWDSGL